MGFVSFCTSSGALEGWNGASYHCKLSTNTPPLWVIEPAGHHTAQRKAWLLKAIRSTPSPPPGPPAALCPALPGRTSHYWSLVYFLRRNCRSPGAMARRRSDASVPRLPWVNHLVKDAGNCSTQHSERLASSSMASTQSLKCSVTSAPSSHQKKDVRGDGREELRMDYILALSPTLSSKPCN